MAITDKIVYDAITILEDGQLLLRRCRIIIDDDGVTEVNRTFFRSVLEPGQDTTVFPARIRMLANFVWTPAIIAAYQAAKLARKGA